MACSSRARDSSRTARLARAWPHACTTDGERHGEQRGERARSGTSGAAGSSATDTTTRRVGTDGGRDAHAAHSPSIEDVTYRCGPVYVNGISTARQVWRDAVGAHAQGNTRRDDTQICASEHIHARSNLTLLCRASKSFRLHFPFIKGKSLDSPWTPGKVQL